MSAIIPFAQGAKLPAYLQRRADLAKINSDVATGSTYPTLSIKGKVFTLVKDGQRKILTRPDDPDEVLQSIEATVIRANRNSRVYYAKAYSEDESEAAKPTCYSHDGIAPAQGAREPQATKCQVCPHAVWGSKSGETGKGTACTVNTRLAIVPPDQPDEPWLLRVPAGSRGNFADACKIADSRGLPYNALVMKIMFDKEAPSPKLLFRPIGLLDDPTYEKVETLYESDEVKEIIGLIDRNIGGGKHEDDSPQRGIEADELDAALSKRSTPPKAAAKAKVLKEEPMEEAPAPAKPKAEAKTKVVQEERQEEVPAPAAKAKPATSSMDDMLSEIDALLGDSTDD